MSTTLTTARGSTFDFRLRWRQSEATDAPVVDMTGCTARLQIRDGADAIKSDYPLTIDTVAGTLSKTLTEADTRLLPVGCLRWGVEVYMPGPRTVTLVSGGIWQSTTEGVR